MDDEDESSEFIIEIAGKEHEHLAALISQTMEESAKTRGTGIAKRSPEELGHHMLEGNAIIAMHNSGRWAGFCNLAIWDNGRFVSNSGLIVASEFRDRGLAKKLKTKLLELSCKKYPHACIIGITTSVAVMKINTLLGFYPTTFSEITKEEKFWEGCRSCVNYDILQRTGKKFCLCTAMRHDPSKDKVKELDKVEEMTLSNS
jgi:hypothetical protein